MNRIKALYRSWAIRVVDEMFITSGIGKSGFPNFRFVKAECEPGLYYAQLDLLKEQRKETKKAFSERSETVSGAKDLATDSRIWSNPIRVCDRSNWNTTSISHEASAVVLQRLICCDSHQFGS